MTEDTTTEQLPPETQVPVELTQEQQTYHLLMLHGDIMQQLMQHERFQFFLASNYDIALNEEQQRFVVKEFPHTEVKQNMESLHKALKDQKSPLVTDLSPEEARKFSKQ